MRAVRQWRGREMVMAGLFLLALLGIIATTEGCLTDAVKKDVAEDVYAAQQAACIDQYDDKASIDKCRDRVKAKWATDAGARTLAFGNDNGHPDAGSEAGR